MRIGEATNDLELIAALNTTRQSRLEKRRGFETIWWNNIALVAGDHYAQWDPNTARFEDKDLTFSDLDGKKPRLVINHALTVGRTELAKLTKSQPIMDVIANSDEQTDIAATKVGQAGLQYAEWRFKLRKLRRNAFWWMIQTGLGAVYVGWDYLQDQAGYFEATIDPETGEPTFDPERERELHDLVSQGTLDEVKRERYPLGDCDYRVFSPFQLFPDDTATDFEELKDLITDEIADIDVLKGLYGAKAADLRPSEDLRLGTMEARMINRAGIGGLSSTQASRGVDNGVKVHTYWLKPNVYRGNKMLRDGICVRWAGNKILEKSTPFPYTDGRIPFVFFQHIPTSTTIWPDSVISHIRGPNLEIDKTVSQLIENKDYMSNPMWLIATQHRIRGEVRNVAGAMVRYRHVPNIPPPTPVEGMQMPQQVENLVMALRQQILEISGQSEVARGGVPSGVRSGVAVAYLQEEDDTKIGPTVQGMEESVGLMASMTLSRFGQFYTIERTLRFYRRDGIFDVQKFKGADLKNNTDVVCQAGSMMPKMKAAKQQYTLELISLGVLRDPHKIEQMLELGQGEPDDVDKAIAQANRENGMMLHGVWKGQTTSNAQESDDARFSRMQSAVPVKAWHNHQVHIQRHTSQMMDEDFDNLAITHPEIVRLFDEHLAMHEQEIAKQQQAQAQMLMAAKGAPDGPPTAATQAAGPGGETGVLATTEQPDPIGGGTMGLRSRDRVQP